MKRRPSVSALLLHPLVNALSGAPSALASFYGATDLSAPLLADADARVTPAQFCVAWSEAVRLTGQPALALRIAEATPPGAFGVVEYLCRAAPTVGEALRLWVRYLNLLDDAVVVGLVQDGAHATGKAALVYLRVVSESDAPAPAAHELCFALVTQVFRRAVAGPFSPVAVEFTHRATAAPGEYSAWFDAPVRFGEAHTQLVLKRADLDTPLISTDPGLLAVLTRHADLLASAEREPPVTTAVGRALQGALTADRASVEEVAKTLGMTARTLQRRLEDEDTTFLALREAVRRRLATRYLDQSYSLSEVAYLLGFSEPSAFFRAFKRWTGQTPQAARLARQSAAVAV